MLFDIPLELVLHIASFFGNSDAVTPCRLCQTCTRFDIIFSSNYVWQRIWNMVIHTWTSLPKYITENTVRYRTRYIRWLYWFYTVEVPRAFQNNRIYPARITCQKEGKLKALENSGFIPQSWISKQVCRKRKSCQ